METGSQNKFYKALSIGILVIVITIAIVTTIILNDKQRELDDLNNKNDEIENVINNKENFENILNFY